MEAKFYVNTLNEFIPNAVCELIYTTPFELLVSTILAAQCTDKRVNEVTKEMYKNYNKPEDFAFMPQEVLEEMIHSCGFYHNKAKHIISMSKDIMEKFGGEVPNNLEDLQSLAGVGRKTANVVYSAAFGGDAIAVDTHVFRVSNRLGIVKAKNPLECELQLMEFFDKKDWSRLHYQLVLFGRYTCTAVKPKCDICPFYGVCPSRRADV